MSQPPSEAPVEDLSVSTEGAQFYVYLSPEHDTSSYVTQWAVEIQARDNNWSGTITSDAPHETLQTPGLSGLFDVTVVAEGPHFDKKQLDVLSGCKPNIGCRSVCTSMVQILATKGGHDAHYCTVWDAFCRNEA